MGNNTVAKSTIGCIRWVENLYLLPEAQSPMYTTAQDNSAELAVTLLTQYSFDLSGYSATELVNIWQKQYPVNWLHFAVIEALYQGRYKAISVNQILTIWHRRGQANYHFNMEFERLICSKFPDKLTSIVSTTLPPTKIDPTNDVNSHGNLREEVIPPANVALIASRREEKKTDCVSTSAKKVPVLSTAATSQKLLISSTNSAVYHKLAKLLPKPTDQELPLPAVNNPPIGQFTPEKSDRSESFTSKLRAIIN